MPKRRKRKKAPRQVRRPIPPPPPFWRLRLCTQFGQEILEEHEKDSALAFDLWTAARRVRSWVESARRRPERQVHALSADAGQTTVVDQENVSERLSWLAKVNMSAAPGEIGAACEAVSRWAEANDQKETQVQFADLAARADWENPARANAAGRVCRDAALYDRAELWFERAYRYAVRSGNRDEAVRALLGNGALLKERGRLPAARRWFLKAAKRAARTGRKRLAAEARHDLLTLAAERGNLAEVVEHAAIAIELYPLNNARMPYLAHDFAFVLVRNRMYQLALPLFESFLKVIPPHELLPGLSTFGWAAAGCGLHHRYEDAERRTLKRLTIDAHKAAASFIHLAEGARLLTRWTLAESYAAQAVAAACERGQKDLEREARALLASVQSRIPAKPPRPSDQMELQPLLRYFALRLRRWKRPPDGNAGRGEASRAAGGDGLVT